MKQKFLYKIIDVGIQLIQGSKPLYGFPILSFLFVVLVTANLKGQSTYLLPSRGAMHTYAATVADPGNNNPVRWFVATDVAGSTHAVHRTDYTFVTGGFNAPNNQLEGAGIYSVDIIWGKNIAIGKNFFVFIEVDDDVTHCTNRMAVQVTISDISADFNTILSDVTGSSSPGTVDPTTVPASSCPGDVIDPIWNGISQTNIGYSDLIFRVNRQYSLAAWQFEYSLTEKTSLPITVQNVRVVNESGNQIYSGTNTTGIINLVSSENYALIYVRVSNQQGVALDIKMELLTEGNNTKDADNKTDGVNSDNMADHTIEKLPAITGFGGN